MNKKGIIISGLLTVIISFLLTISFITNIADEKADKKDKEIISNNVDSIYQVYLDGEKIGLINSEEKLYDLINQEQIEIKKKYNVDHVYPPIGFQIVETNTYNNQLSTIEKVYDTIIPRLVRLSEAPSHGKPIHAYDPRSRGTEAYINLAKEVIERNGN